MEVYRFKNLDRWDKFTIPHLHFPTRFPSARIGDLIRPRNEMVDRSEHLFSDLQPITIHFGGDISPRSVNGGRDYTMALKWVRPNDLVLSKIDLKNGAVGVLPGDWSNAVVTTHFVVYEPDLTRVEPLYLRYLVQTSEFKRWLWANRSGADGRTEVKLPVFVDLEVPLPAIDEQRTIVAAYDAAMAEATARERAADAAEAKAMADFEAVLGFAPPVPLPDRPVFVASYKDFDRWSHEGVLRRIAGEATASTNWPIVQLREVIADLENGWSPKCLDHPAEADEWGVLKLGAVSFGSFDENQNKALPPQLKPRPALEVRAGQVLISRANITRLVGATALVRETRRRLMLCDKIFRVVWREPSPVTPEFITEVLRINEVRRQIETKLTGTSPTMKNISKPALLSLTFPLPLRDDQRTLIEALGTARAAATGLRAEAAATRAAARVAFEQAVYAAETVGPPHHPPPSRLTLSASSR